MSLHLVPLAAFPAHTGLIFEDGWRFIMKIIDIIKKHALPEIPFFFHLLSGSEINNQALH